MANWCSYSMRVKGSKESKKKFIDLFLDDNNDNSHKKVYFARTWTTDDFEDLRRSIDEEEVLTISGYCAWSVNTCMFEGYPNVVLKDGDVATFAHVAVKELTYSLLFSKDAHDKMLKRDLESGKWELLAEAIVKHIKQSKPLNDALLEAGFKSWEADKILQFIAEAKRDSALFLKTFSGTLPTFEDCLSGKFQLYNSVAILPTLPDVCRALKLEVQVASEEPGIGFVEFYHVDENGEVLEYFTYDMEEDLPKYPDLDENDEYILDDIDPEFIDEDGKFNEEKWHQAYNQAYSFVYDKFTF